MKKKPVSIKVTSTVYQIVNKHRKIDKRTFTAQLEYIVQEWQNTVYDIEK